jgi:hypothetical protein
MNHVTGTEASAVGYHRLSDGNGTLTDRVDFDTHSAGVLDRPSHPATHPGMVIGRIHDRVRLHPGYVALHHMERDTADTRFHSFRLYCPNNSTLIFQSSKSQARET